MSNLRQGFPMFTSMKSRSCAKLYMTFSVKTPAFCTGVIIEQGGWTQLNSIALWSLNTPTQAKLSCGIVKTYSWVLCMSTRSLTSWHKPCQAIHAEIGMKCNLCHMRKREARAISLEAVIGSSLVTSLDTLLVPSVLWEVTSGNVRATVKPRCQFAAHNILKFWTLCISFRKIIWI